MSHQEVPLRFEELSKEERTNMKVRLVHQNNRLVRSSPGDVLLPYDYASLANHFYNFEFRSDDIVVLTFPKSGTVWMAEILWAMTHIDEVHSMETRQINSRSVFLDIDFLDSDRNVNDTPLMKRFREECPEGQIENGIMLQLAKAQTSRRIIKSHLQFQFFNPSLLSNCKVVYVTRNPRDVCVSFYFFLSAGSGTIIDGDFSDFAESFMEGKITYTPYWAHLHEAWKLRDHPNLHFVFYEDMKDDIMEELRKLNDFLNVDLTADQLKKVIEATSFDNMRSRDLKMPIRSTSSGESFFRKGTIGDWKNMASAELDAKMDRWIKENSKNIDIKFKYT